MPITLPKPIVGTDGRMITAVIPQLTLPKPSAPPPAPIPNPYTGIAEEVVDPYAGIADEITPATVKQPDPYAGIADEILPAPIAPQPAFPAPLAPISPVASVVPPIAPPVEKNWQDAMLGSNWMSVLPFVGSAKEAADSINILALANRIEKGEGSPEDERTLNAFIIDSQTPRTWGYNLTKGLLQLPAFAIELGLTGGTYTAGKAVGTQALKKGLLKYAGSKAGKAAIWVGGRAVGVAAQTAVAAAPRIVTGTVQNITPEIGMDAAGEITFKHNEDNLLKAAFRSYGEQYLQVGSERFGNLLDRTGAGKLFQNSLRKYLKINPSKRVEDFMNIVRNKALRNSFVAETIEEEIIKPAEVLTGMGTQLRGEENTMAARFHEQYSWSQFLQQSLILAVPTLGGAVINRLGTPVKPMSPKWTSTDDYHARLKSIGLTDSQIGNFDQQLALAKSPEETTEITERLAAQFSDTIAPPVEAPIAPAAPKVAPAPVEGVAPVPAPAVAEIPPVPEVVAKPGVKPPELMTSDVAKKLGYNVGPVWHGTYADKFNEFLPWSHFGHKSTALERVEQDEVRGSRPVGSHRLEQVYLKLNPLRVKAEAAWSTEGPFTGLLQELKKNGIITQAESADILRKYDAPLKRIDLVATETEKNQLREQSKKIWQNLIENALSKKGYDGLVYRDQGSFGDSFVVFHPEQIKPAETEPPLPPPAPPTPIKVETPAPAPADVTDTQLPLETRAGTILPEARPEVAKRPELMTPESKADFREKSLVVQKKIDDLETLLIKKHGKDYFNDAIAYEIAKKENDLKIVQAIKSKYGDDVKTLDAIERLVKDRNVVDDAEIDSFIHTVVISSQLPKSETRQALEELGIGKGNLSENYYKWDTHHTHILDTLYGHFMKGEGWAKFVWGGTGDNPKIQAAFFNEDGIQTRPNREAALKTIATYDAMAEANGSPSLRDIAGGELVQDLPKQLKQPAAPEEKAEKPILTPPPTPKPIKEGVMAPRTPEVGAGVISKPVKTKPATTEERRAAFTGQTITRLQFIKDEGGIKSTEGLSEEEYGVGGKGGPIDISLRPKEKGKGRTIDVMASMMQEAGLLERSEDKNPTQHLLDWLNSPDSKMTKERLDLVEKQRAAYEQGIIEEGAEAERLAPIRAKEFTEAQTRLKTKGDDIASPIMGVGDKFMVEGKPYKITAEDEQGFRAEGETVFWIPYKQAKEGVGIYVDKGSYRYSPMETDEIRTVTRQSRAEGPAKGVPSKQGQYLVDEMMKAWENQPAGGAMVMQSESDLDALGLSNESRKAILDSKAEGFYHIPTETVVIIADNLQRPSDAIRVMLHESIGHFGIRKVLGAEFDTELERLGKLIPAADLQKAIDTYGEDLAVEEYLAKEAPLRNPTLWQQFIKAVRAALQRIGVDPNILNKWDTRGEIDKLIDTARDWMERGEAKPAAPVAGEVRLAGPDTREYKLETETPDQWRSRATLEKQNAEAKRQSDLLKEKAAEPIKGGMGDTTGSLFKGETDLFGVRLSRREHGPAKLERQKLTSEVIDRLGDQMYRQGVNEEQVDKGRQYIEDKGIDQATLDFYSRKNDLTAPDRQVLGWMLAEQHDIAVEEAVRTGDKKAEELHAALSVDILDQMNDWATEFGQAGQTFAIWNNTLEIPAAARMKFKKVVKSFVDMKMNNADIQEAVRKLNEENAPAIDETLQEDYVQERIADVIHKMGVRAFNGMPDRMKKASYMQGVQDFLSRPENVEADTTDIRFAGGEVSLDMKIDKAARYGVGVLAKQGNTSFSAFSEAMTKKYGPNIEKYLPRIYDQSGVLLDQAGMQGAPKAKGADTRVGRSANAAIKTALKQWFAADVNVGREPILDLLKEVGLTEKEAVSLVMGVQQKFIERANKAKMRAVSKMTTGRRVSLNNQKAIKRLLDLSNITPLSDPIVRDAIAKAYGLPEMTPELGAKLDAMAKAIKAAPEGSPTDNAVRVMLDFMRKQMPRDDMDVGWAMWYSQILSGYQTAERNFIGTALNAFDNLATSMIVEPKNAGFALVGFSHGLKAGMSAAGNVLKTGIFPARGGKFEMSSTLELDPFTGYFKFFNNWKFVLRSLQAADMLFFKASQESRAMMIAADIVRSKGARDNADLWQQVAEVMGTTEVQQSAFMRQATELEGLQGVEAKARTQELAERQRPAIMQAEPLTYAQQSTFNHPAEGMLGVFSRTIRDLTRKVPFGRTIIPFTQIVANVTNVSLDHTPWGFVRAWKGMKDSSGVSQPITGHRRAQLLAKATMGTAAMVAAYALDKIGGDDDEGNKLFEITGAGTGDFNKDNQMKETGWRPWSIRIRGGSYWDYRLSPMAIGFAIIGSMRDAERYKKLTEVDLQSRLAYAMLNSGSVIYNMSFLSGVDQVAKLIEVGSPESSKRKAYAYLERLGSSVAVPALLKQIDRTFDPNVHDNSTIMEGVLREIPIASRLARPKLNMLGEPIKQTTGPVSIFFSKSMSDPVWKLIVDKEAFISKPSTSTELKYFDQATCKQVVSRMTEDEYYRYVEESGKAIRQQIERSLTFLQGAKQDIVEKRIDGFVQIARNRVKNQITRDRRNNESQAPPR